MNDIFTVWCAPSIHQICDALIMKQPLSVEVRDSNGEEVTFNVIVTRVNWSQKFCFDQDGKPFPEDAIFVNGKFVDEPEDFSFSMRYDKNLNVEKEFRRFDLQLCRMA
jgi:hypothetical protein